MNPENLKVLAERASTLDWQGDARLDEVHARINSVRRHRQLAVVGAAVVAVLLALGAGVGLLALTGTDRTPPAVPAPRPTSTPGPREDEPSLRPLVYVSGSNGLRGGTRVHVGDRTVRARDEVHTIEAVDDGAVFVTGPHAEPGESTVWFTDGSAPVRIGRTFGSGNVDFPISSTDVGSLVAWWQPLPGIPGDGGLVVYDAAEGRELARFGSADSVIVGVHDDTVYWLPDQSWCTEPDPEDGCLRYGSVMRFAATTGEQTRVSWASYQTELAGRPRILAAYPATENGDARRPQLLDRSHFFSSDGRRLVAGDEGLGTSYQLRVSRTGQAVRLRLPASYDSAEDNFHLVQWLDDDRFTIVSGFYGHGEPTAGDIMTCRISKGLCQLVQEGPTSTLNLMPGLM